MEKIWTILTRDFSEMKTQRNLLFPIQSLFWRENSLLFVEVAHLSSIEFLCLLKFLPSPHPSPPTVAWHEVVMLGGVHVTSAHG